jgi:hypothetical protein
MPADMQRACSARPRSRMLARVSEAALIKAPAGPVWEAVRAADSARFVDPEHFADAGHVPGTPERAVGEMQYHVSRHADGRATAAVHLVTEYVEGHSAVVQHVGPPHHQTYYLVAPAPGGARLELACRWPARASKRGAENTAADVASRLQLTVNR